MAVKTHRNSRHGSNGLLGTGQFQQLQRTLAILHHFAIYNNNVVSIHSSSTPILVSNSLKQVTHLYLLPVSGCYRAILSVKRRQLIYLAQALSPQSRLVRELSLWRLAVQRQNYGYDPNRHNHLSLVSDLKFHSSTCLNDLPRVAT